MKDNINKVLEKSGSNITIEKIQLGVDYSEIKYVK